MFSLPFCNFDRQPSNFCFIFRGSWEPRVYGSGNLDPASIPFLDSKHEVYQANPFQRYLLWGASGVPSGPEYSPRAVLRRKLGTLYLGVVIGV